MKLSICSVYPSLIALALAAGLSSLLVACAGGVGGSATPTPAATYTIGGNVTGLASGAFVVLDDNGGTTGGNVATVTANGTFTFATPVASGSGYAITVGTQPAGQMCMVTRGSGSNVTANVSTVSVACITSAKYAYVANNGSVGANGVSQYIIGTTGALTANGAAVAAGTKPISVTVDPSGKYAYVANLISNNVSQYTIGASGALTANGAAVAAGSFPMSIVLAP